MFFTPKWKKEAEFLLKGAQKFLNYKKDILKPDRVEEIKSRILDLKSAVKNAQLEKVNEASKQLTATCENSLPHQRPQNWLEENVEIMYVALVVALGLRTYVIQPFRIPTGSMQPTLNGIIMDHHKTDQFKKPSLLTQAYDWASRGRQWRQIISPTDGNIAKLQDTSFLFFSRTKVFFNNGASITFPCPSNELQRALTGSDNQSCLGMPFKKDQVMFQGTIDGGDLVLVNKFSYHFRTPKRGEVFVFDTIGMERKIDLSNGGGRLADQSKATHYIKRLCGLPGDELRVDSPLLYVNGKVATEKGIQNASTLPNKSAISEHGYSFAVHGNSSNPERLTNADATLTLPAQAKPGMKGYAALGDNSGNSLDSRYWGQVNEYNLVGPALFSLWPFTTGHWGFIK